MLLAAGTNFSYESVCLFDTAVRAAAELAKTKLEHVVCVLTRHPADKTDSHVYMELVELANCLPPRLRILQPEGVKTDDIVPAADSVLSYQGSSVGVHAICRRLPFLEYCTSLTRKRFGGSTRGDSCSYWAALGAALEVETANEAADALRQSNPLHLLAQEQAIPERRSGTSVRVMTEVLLQTAKVSL